MDKNKNRKKAISIKKAIPISISTPTPIYIYMVLLVLLVSCAGPSDPVDGDLLSIEMRGKIQEEVSQQEPLVDALTLSAAMARGVAYNIEHRLALMESSLALSRAEIGNYNSLPKIAANAGYQYRNKYAYTSSIDGDSTKSTTFTASNDLGEIYGDLTASWSILDFAMNYMLTKSLFDQAYIKIEQRRKVVQAIVHDVRVTYWQAVAAERMLASINPLMVQINDALRQSELTEIQRLLPPLRALEYQRSLYRILQELEILRQDIGGIKIRLGALINLPSGSNYRILIPHSIDITALDGRYRDITALENQALAGRPELRGQKYKERISSNETRRLLYTLLPDLTLSTGVNYSSNSFLQSSNWISASSILSWNMMSLLSYKSRQEQSRKSEDIERTRTVALATSIITQVHLSVEAFQQSIDRYRTQEKLYRVTNRIMQQVLIRQKSASTPLEKIKAEADNLVGQLRLDLAFADVQSAYGHILVTLGNDPLPPQVSEVEGLAQLISLFDTYNTNYGIRYNVPTYMLYYNH